MINKLAKLLLNSIKTNEPKQEIIRIAKILYKLAARLSKRGVMGDEYHSVMIERFLHVFSGTPGVDKILQTYINNDDPKLGLVFNKTPDPIKGERLKPLLKVLGTREISLIEKLIVESPLNTVIKKYLEVTYNSDGIAPVNVKSSGASGDKNSFIITPSTHFAYRAFFRGVEKEDILKVLRDFTESVLQGWKYTIDHEGRIYYVSNIKKYGYYITLVVGDMTKIKTLENMHHMTLVTIYPNEEARRPSFKPVSGFIAPVEPVSDSKILTPEEFLSSKETGTDTIPLKVWTRGTVYNDANITPAILEYPKQLEKHIGTLGMKKVTKRIGVALRNPPNNYRIRVQIDCPICYLEDGTKTDKLLVFVFVDKESETKYKITSFNLANTTEAKQAVWWEEEKYPR